MYLSNNGFLICANIVVWTLVLLLWMIDSVKYG